jgi:hypothetical protein
VWTQKRMESMCEKVVESDVLLHHSLCIKELMCENTCIKSKWVFHYFNITLHHNDENNLETFHDSAN